MSAFGGPSHARRLQHPGRTDGPAGPPGTDGRTKKAWKTVFYLILPDFTLFVFIFLIFGPWSQESKFVDFKFGFYVKFRSRRSPGWFIWPFKGVNRGVRPFLQGLRGFFLDISFGKLARFLARVLTRIWGRGKTRNTVYSTTRPKEKT